MKSLVAFAVLLTVAVVSGNNKPINHDQAYLEAIIAAIESPQTDPATAAMLIEQLHEILLNYYQPERPEDIITEPAVAEEEDTHDISIEPTYVDPTPVQKPLGSALVQVIVNINSKTPAKPSPVEPENSENDSGLIPEFVPAPAEIEFETINIEDPIIPAPAMNLPDILN